MKKSGLWRFSVVLAIIAVHGEAARGARGMKIETLAEGLSQAYALAFLPDGDILVTEKPGNLRIIRNGALSSMPVSGVLEVLKSQGFLTGSPYAGLLDIALHPQFVDNRFIYLSFTSGRSSANAVRVIRARYVDGRLSAPEVIFTAFPPKATLNHPGGRLAFLGDGTLLITIGDGYEYREQAQDLGSALGKIVRVTDNGGVPEDNPFGTSVGIRSPIWSYGHRHPQGLINDAMTGTVYETEHGPQGGDELNRIERGRNYGWPLATYGIDYSGAYVSPYTEYPGTERPLVQWTPSIAPSGMTQCRHCQWPEWEGDIFVSMLAGRQVRRVRIRDGIATEQQALFQNLGERVRDVRFGPSGALYLILEDSRGRILRVEAGR